MRNKPRVLLTFTSILALFGCDHLIDESGNFAAGAHDTPPSSEGVYSSHPYLSCRAPEDPSEYPPPDPECFAGCGGMEQADGDAYAFCAVECEDASDCNGWDPGGSVVSCYEGQCKWYCDEDHACPSDLECVDRGDPFPGEPTYSGLCYAPDPFVP